MTNTISTRRPCEAKTDRVPLLSLVACLFLFGIGPWPALGETTPRGKLLLSPLKPYGPAETVELARNVEEGLTRRLEAAGHAVIAPPAPFPAPGAAMADAARELKAQCIVFGSVSEVGTSLSIDLRLFRVEDRETPPLSLFVEGTPETLNVLLDQMATRIHDALSATSLVVDVKVQGNRRVDTDAILQAVKARIGKPYDKAMTAEDIKAIFKLGFFDDVQVDVTDAPEGRRVAFLVQEKPAIRNIRVSGQAAITEEKIKEVMNLKAYSIIQEQALQENAEKIEALYADKGYVGTTVHPKWEKVSDQAADVTFEIEEGEKVHVKAISFEDNHAFEDDELKDLMETTEKSPVWLPTWSNIKALFGGETAILKWDALDRDIGRITAFYHNNGYIDARVGKPQVRHEGASIYVSIPVEEGNLYRVGTVTIQEDFFKDQQRLLGLLEITKEEVYSQKVLRQDILGLTELYADEGFAYAEVNPSLDTNPETRRVNITLVVNTGPKVFFERIEIAGNTRTRDKVIRRELRVNELDPFSASGLRKGSQRLNRLGYFEDVNLTPTRGSEEDKMNLRVDVKERATGTFSIGAGYSSVDKLILMGEVSQRNFLGRGQTLSFQGIIGSVTNRYALSFVEPYLLDTKVSFGVDLYNWQREYDDYTKDSTGGAFRLGYPFLDDLSVFVGLRADNTTLGDVSDTASVVIRESLDIKSTRSLSLGLKYDTRDDYYNPSRGWHNSVTLEHAGGPLGGDSAFIKLDGTVSYYHAIWRRLVGHIVGGLGYVTEGSNGRLPIYERFFLGGIDSIRGYKYGRISPIDPITEEHIGGERMGYVQLETIFPLIRDAGLNGVCFLDMGNVWEQEYDLGDLRESVGLGIRWLSPMGPMRIEWGYNLNTQPGDDKSNWEFRIGGTI